MVGKDERSSGVGIAIVTIRHTFAWVNDDFAKIIGYSPENLMGRTFESITHPDDVDLDHDLADRLLLGEIDKYEMEKRYIHSNQSTVPIHLTAALIRDRFGTILYALATVEVIGPRSILRVSASAPLTPKELELDRIRRAVLGH